MCQKAFGSFGAPLVAAPVIALTWTRGPPAEFRSSPVVARGFCAACGTPLYMREDGWPFYELAIGSLDHPAGVAPSHVVGTESKLPWVDTLHSLPGRSTEQDRTPEDLERLVSLQHPEHDTVAWPPSA